MQLRHLRYFIKIVEAGSFSRAASTIHVAQPALSQQQFADIENKIALDDARDVAEEERCVVEAKLGALRIIFEQ
jgi:hypothetical protein